MADDQDEAEHWCAAHKTTHPMSEFYKIKAARYKGGYRYLCKQIAEQSNAKTRKAAPEGSRLRETIRKANRESSKRNPEASRARSAAYRARKKAAQEGDPT